MLYVASSPLHGTMTFCFHMKPDRNWRDLQKLWVAQQCVCVCVCVEEEGGGGIIHFAMSCLDVMNYSDIDEISAQHTKAIMLLNMP